MRRYPEDGLRKPQVPTGSKIKIHSRDKPSPLAAEMVKKINDRQQPGLKASSRTREPDEILIEYDSYDDLTVLRDLMRGTTWRF